MVLAGDTRNKMQFEINLQQTSVLQLALKFAQVKLNTFKNRKLIKQQKVVRRSVVIQQALYKMRAAKIEKG